MIEQWLIPDKFRYLEPIKAIIKWSHRRLKSVWQSIWLIECEPVYIEQALVLETWHCDIARDQLFGFTAGKKAMGAGFTITFQFKWSQSIESRIPAKSNVTTTKERGKKTHKKDTGSRIAIISGYRRICFQFAFHFVRQEAGHWSFKVPRRILVEIVSVWLCVVLNYLFRKERGRERGSLL